jgi:hypothetical protein
MKYLKAFREAAKQGGLSFLFALWTLWTFLTTQRWLF